MSLINSDRHEARIPTNGIRTIPVLLKQLHGLVFELEDARLHDCAAIHSRVERLIIIVASKLLDVSLQKTHAFVVSSATEEAGLDRWRRWYLIRLIIVALRELHLTIVLIRRRLHVVHLRHGLLRRRLIVYILTLFLDIVSHL